MAAPPTFVKAIDEITSLYRSLPPRPSLDELDAAAAVITTATADEDARIADIIAMKKPPDLPDELFFILREFRRNTILLNSHEQMREALHVVDLDRRFQVFDDLLQRASKLISPGDEEGKSGAGIMMPWIDKKDDVVFLQESMVQCASLDSDVNSGVQEEKLSLLMVASLIETSAKTRTSVLNLQGKLMDQVEWIPLSLGKLVDMNELNLSENRLMAFPTTIETLKSLTKLDLHSNQLINLPYTFGELSNLVDLDLHANRLKSLPSSLGNLTHLVNLDVSSNQISVLPDTLGNLLNLRSLNVETNELEELPFTIGSCCSLVELRLDFNELKALPEGVGKLESLEVLTLHYNRIKGLPTTFGSLSKLKELDVSFNELESIPESLCFATSLATLNIGRNFADLRVLPRSIGNLEMLEELDISYNQIRILPDSFRFLSRLRVLDAEETPLEVPPRQVVKLGAQAVVQYMADLVALRETSSETAERKGCWFWLCSLFRRITTQASTR